MKNFIKSVVLIALGTLTVCSSEIDDKHSVTQDKFKELLLTGKSNEGKPKLSLDNNKTFYFKMSPQTKMLEFTGGKTYEENISNVKHYQTVEIKNGYLLVGLDVLNKRKEVIPNVASDYVIKTLYTNSCNQIIDYSTKWCNNRVRQNLQILMPQILMPQLPIKVSLDIFPKYPIVLYSAHSAKEPPSLDGLTLVPTQLYCRVKKTYSLASSLAGSKPEFKSEFESGFKSALADAIWEKLLQTIEDYKAGFSKEKGIFEKGKTIADCQSFQQAKEELFTFLHEVNTDRTEPCLESDFLKYVYQKDKELNDVFFGDKPISSIVDNKAVYDKLNSKDMKTRNTFAKALLLNALFHPDRYSYPELNAKYLFFTQNYGQIARWLQHINPDDDFNHIYTYDEFKNRGDLKFDRSFWVLKEGHSYIDFYKILLGTIAVGQFAYNVNNVEINQRKVGDNLVDSVVIDVEYKKDDLKNLFEKVVSSGVNANEVDANGVRFVVRYNNGLWDLVTTYPIYIKNSNSEIQQTNSVFEELKNFVNLNEYPKTDALAVVWKIGNKRMEITRDLKK